MGKGVFYGCNKTVVFCELETKPSDWHDNWNLLNDYDSTCIPVYWGLVQKNIQIGTVQYMLLEKQAFVKKFLGDDSTFELPTTIEYDGENYAVKSILSGAFKNCNNLKKIVVPNGITDISEGAFYGCGNLESITLPFIGGSIFNTTDSDSTVLGYIFGNKAFEGAISITQYYSGDSSTTIGTSYYIPSSLKEVTITGGKLFFGCFSNCINLTNIVLPENITSIPIKAFYGCSSLESIEIPNSVTSIGENAFYECSSLTSIEIPNNVTSIGTHAFTRCSSLTSIVIPNSVTSIGNFAFNWCDSLTIYCEATSKPGGWSSLWNSSKRPVVWDYSKITVSDIL
ncbi:MAG: leucine-rich repeat domain-containing protein [Bacilli bacterium]|nr:leucine-rich repeat domain-containing protein [Bacilli bacterium]